MLLLWTVLGGCVVCECVDGGSPFRLPDPYPLLVVEPDPVEIAPLGTAEVSLANVWPADLEFYTIELVGDAEAFELGTLGTVLLPYGATTSLPVTHTGEGPDAPETEMWIESNDPNSPYVLEMRLR